MFIGTPEGRRQRGQGYDDVGADQLAFGMLSTTMPIEIAIEAVETFGKHVIPEFDKDPVHSTTRRAKHKWLPLPTRGPDEEEPELPPLRI